MENWIVNTESNDDRSDAQHHKLSEIPPISLEVFMFPKTLVLKIQGSKFFNDSMTSSKITKHEHNLPWHWLEASGCAINVVRTIKMIDRAVLSKAMQIWEKLEGSWLRVHGFKKIHTPRSPQSFSRKMNNFHPPCHSPLPHLPHFWSYRCCCCFSFS